MPWDNGSVDGTESAIKYELFGVVFHHHPKNLEVASGRNAAAQLAVRELSPTNLIDQDYETLIALWAKRQ